MSKHYTADEATRTLPYVRGIVKEACERYADIQEMGRRHNGPKITDEEKSELRDRIRECADRVRECCLELESIGVELKDYEQGLVDFPAEFEGRTVYLCWKAGEESVSHWHETDAGFAGRCRIPADGETWPRGITAASAARD